MHPSSRVRFHLIAFAIGALALLGLSGCADEEQNARAMQQLPWDSPTAQTSVMAGMSMGQQGPQY